MEQRVPAHPLGSMEGAELKEQIPGALNHRSRNKALHQGALTEELLQVPREQKEGSKSVGPREFRSLQGRL